MVIVWTFWLVISGRTYFRDHDKLSIAFMVTSVVLIVLDLAAFKNGWLMDEANQPQRDE